MARKQVLNTLPPLEQSFESFKGILETDIKQQVLIDSLRTAVVRFRAEKPRPFYTMRDVAAFFSVPLRTVAIAYERLEKEGLLVRIRGSHTLITGKDISLTSPVRAVVGIPLWLHAVVVSPFSRMLHNMLEERLRERGFVADIIFFNEQELFAPDFIQRMLIHNLDMVIWHTPHPMATQTLLSLNDRGVRQILVVPSDTPLSLDLPTHSQDWQSAYHTFAKSWHAKGIRHVIVPEPVYVISKRALESFLLLLRGHGLEVEVVAGSAQVLLERVLHYGPKISGVAFLDQIGAETLCNEEPVIIEQILRVSRVAFCRGRIRMPYFNHREGTVDYVAFSPSEVADQLVNDVQNNVTSNHPNLSVFHGRYFESISFSEEIDHL